MSSVNEWVVREYFETLGYLVSQPVKYLVQSRSKTAEEQVDLVVFHPRVQELKMPGHLVWSSEDLRTIPRAVVSVLGWHTDRVYAATIEQAPELFRFTESESMRSATKILGSASLARVLCVPRMPASGELKERTISVLREKGVDGVILFSTMLAELSARVDVNRNYDKSDLLQIIRLLKNYGLINTGQMEFFTGRRSVRTRTKTGTAKNTDAPPVPDGEKDQA